LVETRRASALEPGTPGRRLFFAALDCAHGVEQNQRLKDSKP
jgi:hypothetical protein